MFKKLCLSFILLISFAHGQFETPIDISFVNNRLDGIGFIPQIAFNPLTGSAVCVYQVKSNYWGIQAARTTDDGATFTYNDISLPGGDADTPKIAFDPVTGVGVCVWIRKNALNKTVIQAAYTNDDGVSFSAPIDLSDGAQNATLPQITFNQSGRAICVWIRNNGTNNIVQAAYTDDDGASFSTPIDLSLSGKSATNPQITFDPITGNGVCVWSRINVNDFIQASYTTDGGASFSTPIDLSLSGANSTKPQITFDSLGNGVCIWSRVSTGTQIAKTTDGGVSFSTPLTIGPATSTDVSQISVDPSNNFVAVWQRWDGVHFIIYSARSTDHGDSFSTPITLSDSTQSARGPQIKFDSSGDGICIWARTNGTNYIIQASKTTDGGASFITPVDLSMAGQDASFVPQIAANGSSKFICVWTRFNGAYSIVQAASTTDGGTSFFTAVDVSSGGHTATYPQIKFDSNNNGVAVWTAQNGINYIIQAAKTTDGGATFTSAINLSESGRDATRPQIAFDNSGHGICVWSRSNGTNTVIQAARTTDGGTSFSTPIDISDSSQNATFPQVKFDPLTGNIVCIWQRSNGTKTVIQAAYTTDGGAAFSTPIDLSDGTQNAIRPQIAFDGDGHGICVWPRTNVGGFTVIQAAYTIDGGVSFQTPIDLSDGLYNATYPQITFDPYTGYGVCVWTINITTSSRIQSSVTIDFGVSFVTPIFLSEQGVGSFGADTAQITFDGNGHGICVWTKYDGVSYFVIQSAKTSDGGISFDTPIDLSQPIGNAYTPQISFDSRGRAVCVWYVASSYVQAAITNDYGGSYTSPINLSIGSTNSTLYPQLAFDSYDNCAVVYRRFNNKNINIQAVYGPSPYIPSISAVNPNGGPVSGGTFVTISGNYFRGATDVKFGANIASYTVIDDSNITATSPVNSAGIVDIVVTTPVDISAITSLDEFTYYNVPTIANVSPNGGPLAGGTEVVITGADLAGATSVFFGINSATYFVTSPTSITAYSPATLIAGTVDITITTPGGTSAIVPSDEFTYYNVPSVTGISPNQGPEGGGTSVAISGTDLLGAIDVTFGGASASYQVMTNILINASSPVSSPGTVDVRVRTPGGISPISIPQDEFTYIAQPSVTGVSPNSGPEAGGSLVTITGSHFTGATEVAFGDVSASFSVTDDSHIAVTSPVGSPGTVDIRVTTLGGTSAIVPSDEFTYIAEPVVLIVTPNGGPLVGGTLVTITGNYFSGALDVAFGSLSVSYTINPDFSISAISPAGLAGTVHITITTPGGTSAPTSSSEFIYYNVPSVISIFPNSGPQVGGTSVTIVGSDLLGATDVKFGLNSASFSLNAPNTIIASSPPAANSGTVDIRVTTLGGTSAISPLGEFTYIPYVFSPYGKQKVTDGLFEKDLTNQIYWNRIPIASAYRVYDSNNNLIFQGTDLIYFDHKKDLKKSYTYYVSWIDNFGNESSKVKVTLPDPAFRKYPSKTPVIE